MADFIVKAVVALVSGAFGAGAALWQMRRQGRDLNGLGRKIAQDEVRAARRYHNLSLAILLAAPADKESEITSLLREGE